MAHTVSWSGSHRHLFILQKLYRNLLSQSVTTVRRLMQVSQHMWMKSAGVADAPDRQRSKCRMEKHDLCLSVSHFTETHVNEYCYRRYNSHFMFSFQETVQSVLNTILKLSNCQFQRSPNNNAKIKLVRGNYGVILQ